MSTAERRSIAADFVMAFGGGRIDPQWFAPGWTCHNASLGQISGETYLVGIADVQHILPSLTMTVEGTFADDDRVAVQATSSAPLPDGTQYRNRYALLFRFDSQNRIEHVDAYFDTHVANTQLLPLVRERQRQRA